MHPLTIMVFLWSPRCCFKSLDILQSLIKDKGISLSQKKTKVLWPYMLPPPSTLTETVKRRGLCLELGAMETLGVMVGLDEGKIAKWTENRVKSSHPQLFKALLNENLPVQSAMAILRLSTVPTMNYLTRTTRPDILRPTAEYFDDQVISTACTKLRLPIPLSSEARLSLTLPIREGGFGLRSTVRASPPAYWSAVAQAAPELLIFASKLPVAESSQSPSPTPAVTTPTASTTTTTSATTTSATTTSATTTSVMTSLPL